MSQASSLVSIAWTNEHSIKLETLARFVLHKPSQDCSRLAYINNTITIHQCVDALVHQVRGILERRNADACEACAASTSHPYMKPKWLDLARQWRELADRFERPRTKADLDQGQGDQHSQNDTQAASVGGAGMGRRDVQQPPHLPFRGTSVLTLKK